MTDYRARWPRQLFGLYDGRGGATTLTSGLLQTQDETVCPAFHIKIGVNWVAWCVGCASGASTRVWVAPVGASLVSARSAPSPDGGRGLG